MTTRFTSVLRRSTLAAVSLALMSGASFAQEKVCASA